MVITMVRRMNKQAIVKQNCQNDLFPLAVPLPPSSSVLPYIKSDYVWQHPCSLTAVIRIAYKLVQVSLGIKVIFWFYFTQCHVTSVPPLHHQCYHTQEEKSKSLSVHIIYDISFYFAVFRYWPFFMSPVSSQGHFTCTWFSGFV